VKFRISRGKMVVFSEGIREFYVIEYFRATGSTVLYVLVRCKEKNAAALGTRHRSTHAAPRFVIQHACDLSSSFLLSSDT